MGYQRASMASISARLGGSKATLYGYFNSKEALFAAVMMTALEEQGEQMLQLLEVSSEDPVATLKTFALRYVSFIRTPELQATIRTTSSSGVGNALGVELYELEPKRAWDEIAGYMERLMEAGVLISAPPLRTTYHLKGLLEAGIL